MENMKNIFRENEKINKQIILEDGAIIINVEYKHCIKLHRCDTESKLLGVIYQLSQKKWMTTQHIERFIEIAIKENRLILEFDQYLHNGKTINLNDPDDFIFENVRALIASKDDSQNRQLRVTKHGIAYLSDVVGNIDINDLACRFETFSQGNDDVGLNASKNDSWVREIYNMLKANWPIPKDSYIDY